jgi:hypothetical protein
MTMQENLGRIRENAIGAALEVLRVRRDLCGKQEER